MKAVIYARYSSHNQKEESIEGQLRECHDFASRNGLTVIHEYCDRAMSGKTDKRPAFQQMIKDSEKGRFEAVILYTLDRFARNRYDSAMYKAKLKKNGVRLYYAKQPLPDTPEGIILEAVLEGYAEYYSENLARGVKRGMHEKALQCVALGRAPLGYNIGLDKHYEIDPIGAQAVKLIFEKYINGESQKNISEYLNSHGHRNSTGNKFSPAYITKVLKNVKYIGIYQHDEVVIDGGVPAIIDKGTFERVQLMLEKNKKTKAKYTAKVDYLLSGKIYCGHCGAALIGESGRSKNGTVHHYYKCSGRKRLHNCDKKTERKEWLEQTVVEETVKHVLTSENINLIADKVVELIEKDLNDNSTLTALTESLRDTNNKIKNLIKALEQGIISSATQERLSELEDVRGQLMVQIDEEKASVPIITKDEIVYWLESFQNGDVTSVEYQKRVIDTLVSSVYVFDDGDGGRKLIINFNISENNKTELNVRPQDISDYQYMLSPNIFINTTGFGLIVIKKEVD